MAKGADIPAAGVATRVDKPIPVAAAIRADNPILAGSPIPVAAVIPAAGPIREVEAIPAAEAITADNRIQVAGAIPEATKILSNVDTAESTAGEAGAIMIGIVIAEVVGGATDTTSRLTSMVPPIPISRTIAIRTAITINGVIGIPRRRVVMPIPTDIKVGCQQSRGS